MAELKITMDDAIFDKIVNYYSRQFTLGIPVAIDPVNKNSIAAKRIIEIILEPVNGQGRQDAITDAVSKLIVPKIETTEIQYEKVVV